MRKATEEWIRAAEDDLETIEEIVDNPQLTHIVAVHAQQAVEKCFKALLEERERDIPKVHNLITLLGRIDEGVFEDIDVDMLDRLNQLYIEARYPGELGLLPEGKPSMKEARSFQRFAEQIYQRTKQELTSAP